MCEGCRIFKKITPLLPDELTTAEVIILAVSILEAYLSHLDNHGKIMLAAHISNEIFAFNGVRRTSLN